MREIKFRAWDKKSKKIYNITHLSFMRNSDGTAEEMGCEGYYGDNHRSKLCLDNIKLMQYTGLKDKNGLQEVYEGDIIDEYGNIKGNIYEMDAGETDFIIQGFGDKNWGATYQNAVDRGCKDSE